MKKIEPSDADKKSWAEIHEHVNKAGGRITQFVSQKGMTSDMEFTGEGIVKDSVSDIETIAQFPIEADNFEEAKQKYHINLAIAEQKFIAKLRDEEKNIAVPNKKLILPPGNNGRKR